jgi:flagellar hook assembly protein FlgD
VTDLVDEYIEPGAHRVAWNGQDSEGRDMGSGIYYYRLVTGDAFSTGKMILLR